MLFSGCLLGKGQLLVFGTVSVQKALDQAISFLDRKKENWPEDIPYFPATVAAKSLCSCEGPTKRFKKSICSADRQTVIPLAGLANQSPRTDEHTKIRERYVLSHCARRSNMSQLRTSKAERAGGAATGDVRQAAPNPFLSRLFSSSFLFCVVARFPF